LTQYFHSSDIGGTGV